MTCWLCGFETTELATNAKPSTCKNGSCQICIAVEEVDKEIDQAMANLRRLIATRRHLHSEQNRTHDLVHRLPVEVKNYIFELLRPWNEWGVIPHNEKTVMPSFLASICKGWRDIVWSNPFLWSSIHIPIGRRTTPDSSKYMRDWILRSGTLPLTFHIQVVDLTKEGIERSRNVVVPILDAISQCSYRLQSLSLDVPFSILCAYPSSNFQWDRLTRLRSISSVPLPKQNPNQPLSLFNPTASPEMVELYDLPLRSLQISWNRLSTANIRTVGLEDLTRLFQQASQLTECYISYLKAGPCNFSVPPITHHRLKILALWSTDSQAAVKLLRSLTLPCLQELSTNEFIFLMHLPALVCRSSCPLTKLILSNYFNDGDLVLRDPLPSLPGVTDLVVRPSQERGSFLVKKLLLEDYLPDLRHLTFRLEAFLSLWNTGVVPLYLDRKRPLSDGFDKLGGLETFLVLANDPDELDRIWNSDVGEELKALNASLREDGFEFL